MGKMTWLSLPPFRSWKNATAFPCFCWRGSNLLSRTAVMSAERCRGTGLSQGRRVAEPHQAVAECKGQASPKPVSSLEFSLRKYASPKPLLVTS